jgi:hypothetical protein
MWRLAPAAVAAVIQRLLSAMQTSSATGAARGGTHPLLLAAAWFAVPLHVCYLSRTAAAVACAQCCAAGGRPVLCSLCGGGGAPGHNMPQKGLMWWRVGSYWCPVTVPCVAFSTCWAVVPPAALCNISATGGFSSRQDWCSTGFQAVFPASAAAMAGPGTGCCACLYWYRGIQGLLSVCEVAPGAVFASACCMLPGTAQCCLSTAAEREACCGADVLPTAVNSATACCQLRSIAFAEAGSSTLCTPSGCSTRKQLHVHGRTAMQTQRVAAKGKVRLAFVQGNVFLLVHMYCLGTAWGHQHGCKGPQAANSGVTQQRSVYRRDTASQHTRCFEALPCGHGHEPSLQTAATSTSAERVTTRCTSVPQASKATVTMTTCWCMRGRWYCAT